MTHADRAREILDGTDCNIIYGYDTLVFHTAAALADAEREAMEKACRAVCAACEVEAEHRRDLRTYECDEIRAAFAAGGEGENKA